MTPIDSPEALKAARKALGLTLAGLADRLRLAGDNGADAVRAMESGKRPITGPVAVAVEYMVREVELAPALHVSREATDARIDQALAGFMGARCRVSSQHKLPVRGEILQTSWARFFTAEEVEARIDAAVREGRLIEYGPYLSDRPNEVL
jgi:transcriptional regulator with XRE-family HTH domain